MASHLKRSWQSLLKDHFEEAMRTSSSAPPLMANPFVRTEMASHRDGKSSEEVLAEFVEGSF